MARTVKVPWFQREDYDAIKRLIADDTMPRTFEQWLEAESKSVNELETRGLVVEKVIVDPQQFTAYCRASGIDHNYATLGAFTVAMARKQHEGGE